MADETNVEQKLILLLQKLPFAFKVANVEGKYVWRAFDRAGSEATFVQAFEKGLIAYSEILGILIATFGGEMELRRLEELQEQADRQSGGVSKRNYKVEYDQHEQRLHEAGLDDRAVKLLLTIRSRYGRNAATLSEALAFQILQAKTDG